MALIEIIEVFILCVGIYYLYYLFKNYSTIKRKKIYQKYKNQYLLSLLGAIGIIISFQIFWLSNFYSKHPYIEILIKIILGILSIINQILMKDLEKAKTKTKNKKKYDDDFYFLNESSDKNTGFKLINRLYLLNIVLKILNRKPY